MLNGIKIKEEFDADKDRSLGVRWTLDAVENWATGAYWMERETGIVLEGSGRLDAVLVPISHDASAFKTKYARGNSLGLLGIEVKLSRADFLAGMRRGQFESYRDDPGIVGLFVVTPRGICKTAELPGGVGHLVVNEKERPSLWTAVCKRNPIIADRPTPPSVLWRLIFRMRWKYSCWAWKEKRDHAQRLEKVGYSIGTRVHSLVKRIDKELSG